MDCFVFIYSLFLTYLVSSFSSSTSDENWSRFSIAVMLHHYIPPISSTRARIHLYITHIGKPLMSNWRTHNRCYLLFVLCFAVRWCLRQESRLIRTTTTHPKAPSNSVWSRCSVHATVGVSNLCDLSTTSTVLAHQGSTTRLCDPFHM